MDHNKTNTIQDNLSEIKMNRLWGRLFWILVAAALFVFFRYVHPIVIWDGDDWHTNCYDTQYIFTNILRWKTGVMNNSNILGNLLGTFFGYITGFVIYPITGDYIGAFMTADALSRTLFICLSLLVMFKQLELFFPNRRLALAGFTVFLSSAFILMKTNSPGQYLYWSYNRCALYYYCIPSYLGGAFSLYLIQRFVSGDEIASDSRTALVLAASYFLIFSFFPAAALVAITAFVLSVWYLITHKSFKALLQKNWLYIVILIMFAVKVLLEFSRVFSTGYFNSPGNLLKAILDTLRLFVNAFSRLHVLFKLLASIGILLAVDSAAVSHYKKQPFDDTDKIYLSVTTLLLSVFAVLLVFYALFGSVSLKHFQPNGTSIIRTDTLYCLFFIPIVIVTVSWIYVLSKLRKIRILLPTLLLMMLTVIVSPESAYCDGVYMSTTARQKYDFMSDLVEAAELKDAAGETTLTIHTPDQYIPNWSSSHIGKTLQRHHVTNSNISIQFVYDKELAVSEIWFE